MTALSAVFAERLPDPAGFEGVLADGERFWTASGRQALWLMLRALPLNPGAGVAVPLYTDLAVSSAVRDAGFVPVFVDVDEATLTMEPGSLIRVRNRVSAVIAVHMFGHMSSMHELLAACRGLPLIEDTVHAPMSFFDGRPAGSFGLGCFYSFGSTKCLAAGGGGLAVINDCDLARRMGFEAQALVPQGFSARVRNLLGQSAKAAVFQRALYGAVGRTLRPWAEEYQMLEPMLDTMAIQPGQAAVALQQAVRFARRVVWQRENSFKLLSLLSDVEEIVLPRERPSAQYNFHIFPVLLRDADERDSVAGGMLARHVDTSRIYSNVVEHARTLGYTSGCPVAESVAHRVLTLPNYAGLSDRDIEIVAEAFRESLGRYRSRSVSKERCAVSASWNGECAGIQSTPARGRFNLHSQGTKENVT